VYEAPSTSQDYSISVTDRLGKYVINFLFIQNPEDKIVRTE